MVQLIEWRGTWRWAGLFAALQLGKPDLQLQRLNLLRVCIFLGLLELDLQLLQPLLAPADQCMVISPLASMTCTTAVHINNNQYLLYILWHCVTTMSNSGPYPVTPVASQLYSSTLVAHHLLQSWSCRYTSAMYDPWSNPYTVLTTPHCLPWLDVSSPCARYISYLVSFSLDLVYFTRTWLYFTRTWPSTFSGYPLSAF